VEVNLLLVTEMWKTHYMAKNVMQESEIVGALRGGEKEVKLRKESSATVKRFWAVGSKSENRKNHFRSRGGT